MYNIKYRRAYAFIGVKDKPESNIINEKVGNRIDDKVSVSQIFILDNEGGVDYSVCS